MTKRLCWLESLHGRWASVNSNSRYVLFSSTRHRWRYSPPEITHYIKTPEVSPVSQLGSGLCLVGWTALGIRMSASFQIFALKVAALRRVEQLCKAKIWKLHSRVQPTRQGPDPNWSTGLTPIDFVYRGLSAVTMLLVAEQRQANESLVTVNKVLELTRRVANQSKTLRSNLEMTEADALAALHRTTQQYTAVLALNQVRSLCSKVLNMCWKDSFSWYKQ